jgi:hypothetical protein
LITLGLRDYVARATAVGLSDRPISLEAIEQQLSSAVDDLATLLEQERRRTVLVPTDLILNAMPMLFPPERMLIASGRTVLGRMTLGSLYDVTSSGPGTHRAHVEADPNLLGRALINFDLAGVELGAWIHSHPGHGPLATMPSSIDLAQYAAWTHDFSADLMCMIMTQDGFLRIWGCAFETGRLRVDFCGNGITTVGGHRNVYRLIR